MKRWFVIIIGCCVTLGASAQLDVQQTADSIVKYQMKSGGWPKNQDWLKGVDPKQAKEWEKKGIGSTIDNGATTKEMETLAKALEQLDRMVGENSHWLDKELVKERKKRYTEAFNRGLEFFLDMQYDNGGFPQFYPARKKEPYTSQITFNDNATVNVLRLMKGVLENDDRFKYVVVEKSIRKKCRAAYEKGIQCILDCQIRVDESGKVLPYGTDAWKTGKRTVWCQQHDKKTLAPVKARAYELPSFTGNGETCTILQFLMDLPNPSAEVREAVKCGVEWLEAHVMKDMALERFRDEQGREDVRLVKRQGSELWARYYDLEQAEPMFCDRDGIPRKHLSDIGYERRTGYSWAGDSPRRVMERYKNWKKQ